MEPLGDGDPRWVGAYRLLGRLGAGGMGRVYLARSERGRTVAVKVVQEELARQPAFRERFAKEVTAARRVGGEWTAPVLDADTDAETPWVATGYIAGPSLQTVVDEDYGPLPEHTVYALAAGLVEALRAIHGAGLVHRDLKPSNVLVTIDGPKVIDFGIARALDSVTSGGLTQTGAVIGSPGFMSPEQVRGERVEPASDVFCLGTVLAYAATGRMPFGTADSGFHALLFRIAEEAPDLSGLTGTLRELVAGCLAKNPADRPTLDDLAARIEAHVPRGGTWLPGEVLAQLGRHAVRLLDSEDPDATSAGAFGPSAAAGTATPPPAPAGGPGGFTGMGMPSTPPPPSYPSSVPVTAPINGPLNGPVGGPLNGPVAGPYGGAGRPWNSTPPPGVTAPYPAAAGARPGMARSARGLSLALCAALSALLLCTLVQFVVHVRLYDELEALTSNSLADPALDYESLVVTSDVMTFLGGLFGLPVVVLWLVWFWRVRMNAEAFAPGQIRHAPGWAIGSWLVPVVCFFMPKQIMNDICDHSDPTSTRTTWYGPRQSSNRGLLNGWWTLWLIGLVGGVLNHELWYEAATVEDAEGTVALSLMLDLLAVPATVLAILVVLRLTALQEDRITARR
ncbi:protein kinase domain-containing protein, partial [Streptomyces megasporus]|uniref:protein kinase domain-containing protein n=1 Tax=Streptomyces megasporus TaxID=44060 RepID=UPI0004E27BE4